MNKNNKVIIKLTPAQIHLLTAGNIVIDSNGDKYYSVPQVFKRINEDEFEIMNAAVVPGKLLEVLAHNILDVLARKNGLEKRTEGRYVDKDGNTYYKSELGFKIMSKP